MFRSIAIALALVGCGVPGARVVSTPGRAYVYADGRYVGRSPIQVRGQRVLVFKPGYLPRSLDTSHVGEADELRVVLEPIPPPPLVDEETRRSAWWLFEVALLATHAGDCAVVRGNVAAIKKVDPIFASLVVAHETGIRGCVAP